MQTFSDKDIKQVCENLRDSTRNQEEFKSLLDSFCVLCCGPEIQTKNPVLNVLNYEELLLCFLKDNNCNDHLRSNPVLCVKILKGLLSVSSSKNWRIIISLFKNLLQSEFEDKEIFFQDIWIKKDLYALPAELVLIFVINKPLLIEKSLLNIYIKRECNKNLWRSDLYLCWIKWCSLSSKLFQIVTSFLNQVLILAKVKSAVLKLNHYFISDVKAECEQNGNIFFSLYPLEYQSLASLLSIDPELNHIKKEIIKKLMILKNSNPTHLLLFLSHFPCWADIVVV